MSYLPAVRQYPVSGQLVDGIYDPVRDVYYFSDAAQIRVFSLAQNTWLASIPVPAPRGAYGPERLWGMSLSPDGSRLVVADAGSIAIDVIDLNQPSSIQSYPLVTRIFGDPITEVPTTAAIINSGIIYIATSDLNGDGGSGFLLKLDPSASGYLPNVGPAPFNALPTQGGMIGPALAISSDGSRIYYDDAGQLGWVDTTSGVVSAASITSTDLGLDDYEIELGANQTHLYGDGFLTDSNLNGIGLQSINFAESIDASYLYGGALSADGALFYQPGTQAIDVFDGVTGSFRARVALPVTLAPNLRALVSNHRDSTLVAITGDTGNGIAVIDLNSLPEPNPLPWLSSSAAPTARYSARTGSAPLPANPNLLFKRMQRPFAGGSLVGLVSQELTARR